jgi:hypothetical protein
MTMEMVNAAAMSAADLYDMVLSKPGPFLITELHPGDDFHKLRKRLSAAASYRGRKMTSHINDKGLEIRSQPGH